MGNAEKSSNQLVIINAGRSETNWSNNGLTNTLNLTPGVLPARKSATACVLDSSAYCRCRGGQKMSSIQGGHLATAAILPTRWAFQQNMWGIWYQLVSIGINWYQDVSLPRFDPGAGSPASLLLSRMAIFASGKLFLRDSILPWLRNPFSSNPRSLS